MPDEDGLSTARAELESAGHEVVIEEYVAGPSLSLEVLCWDGRAVSLQATGLEFDAGYDCKRVVAPVGEAPEGTTPAGEHVTGEAWNRAVAPGVLAAFDAVTVRLAEGLGLRGLMDIEVMVLGLESKVLEIDARLPSQTPTAVYWSSGLNIVELLHRTVCEGRVPDVDRSAFRACVFQHVHAEDDRLTVLGEHVMGCARPLALLPGFFGAHEALTDYESGCGSWSATLITLGASVQEAQSSADDAVAALAAEEHLCLLPEGESR